MSDCGHSNHGKPGRNCGCIPSTPASLRAPVDPFFLLAIAGSEKVRITITVNTDHPGVDGHPIAIAKVQEALSRFNPWKEAVIDACVLNHLGWHENDPWRTLRELSEWEQEVALDPLVSKEAQELIDKGKAETRQELAQRIAEHIECVHELRGYIRELQGRLR